MKYEQYAHKNEKGQIIIILAIAFVAILAITGLAVDGSLIYTARRTNQSTSDSSALAGAGAAAQYLKTANMAGFSCGTTVANTAKAKAVDAAKTSALQDGITLVTDDMTVSGVTTTCGVENGRKYIDVKTIVTTEVKPFFMGIVSTKPSLILAEATARVYINTSFAGGNAIVTTGTACSATDTGGGVFTSGTGTININAGGIYSASCISSSGSSKTLVTNGIMQYYGRGTKTFYVGSQVEYSKSNGILFAMNAPNFLLNDLDTTSGPSISAALTESYQLWSTYTGNPNIDESLWPKPTTQTVPTFDIEAMTVPSCTGLPARTFPTRTSSNKVYTVYPGIYSSITWNNWGDATVTFSPGVYCIDSQFTLGGGSDIFKMDNVVLYFRNTGGISFGGTVRPSLNNSTVYINNGNFVVGSGITLYANNITVYINQGNFTVDGAGTGLMSAPGCNTSDCGVGPSIPGVLLYMPSTNTGKVTIAGSGALEMTGTMYAPNSPYYISGDSGMQALNVQVIGRMVSVSGSSTINMDQSAATLYSQSSTTIQLLK
jgi:hypothetical protein